MSLAELPTQEAEKIPQDRFGVRLAIIRAEMGWNVTQAADVCGTTGQSWHNWEAGGTPRDYEQVCSRIAEATGYAAAWIKAGGALRSRCFSPLALVKGGAGQLEMDFDPPARPALAVVGGR